MKNSKILISILLMIIILSISIQSFAKTFELKVKFDGKNIVMESETTDMSWELDNFLPGSSDTSSITIKNEGQKDATVETSISIEEDTGLLEMIDLTVTNKEEEVVYSGKYTELKTINQALKPGEVETYTAKTSLNINAGNEYQDKQYKLKFNFKAIGQVPYGQLIVKYVDENGNDLEPPTIETKKVTSEKYNLPATGKVFEGYSLDRVEGELSGEYKEEGTTVTYYYHKIEYGNLIVQYVDTDGKLLEQTSETKEIGQKYELSNIGKEIPGYIFKEVEGEISGEFKEEDTIVKYIYEKEPEVKKGKLIIQYVDQDNELLEQEIFVEDIGTTYELENVGKEIEGYEFIAMIGEPKGEYKKEDTIIIYKYEKIRNGRLIILCIDENNKIIKQTVTTEKVGTIYDLDEVGEEIEGYRFLGIEGEPKGKYKIEDTVIKYKYESIKDVPVTENIILPQTGESNQIYMAFVGVIVGVLLLLVVAKKSRK